MVARIDGADATRPALLIHGHLDVVPAHAPDWQHPPFSGELADGCLWGRGAIDMKDMDAMMLAVVRQRQREQRPPARDIVLAFTADEEAGGTWGARWLVENHADLFEGVTEAVGEVGGFSLTLGRRRLYLLQVAEKGIAWMRLTARGTAGHGSMINRDNAVTELAEAIGRLGRHEWPVRLLPSVGAFLEGWTAAFHRMTASGCPVVVTLPPAATMRRKAGSPRKRPCRTIRSTAAMSASMPGRGVAQQAGQLPGEGMGLGVHCGSPSSSWLASGTAESWPSGAAGSLSSRAARRSCPARAAASALATRCR